MLLRRRSPPSTWWGVSLHRPARSRAGRRALPSGSCLNAPANARGREQPCGPTRGRVRGRREGHASAHFEDIGDKNPAAVALGRLGCAKGGRARAERLSADQRRWTAQLIAKRAACSTHDRWLPMRSISSRLPGADSQGSPMASLPGSSLNRGMTCR